MEKNTTIHTIYTQLKKVQSKCVQNKLSRDLKFQLSCKNTAVSPQWSTHAMIKVVTKSHYFPKNLIEIGYWNKYVTGFHLLVLFYVEK